MGRFGGLGGLFFFFSSRRRHTRLQGDWSSDVCSSDLNDARAYYERAVPLIQAGFNLDTADMALYWAARLDPDWANPLYARAMVILRALRADLLFALFRYRSTLRDRKSTRLNSSHLVISYAVFCLKKKKT